MNTRALIASLEAAPIGDGDLLGEPFRTLPYQRRFLRGAFRPGVLRAGLSLARGGGKTGLASALALDAIRPDGVLHRPGGETVLVASSFAQARLGFEAVRASLELLGEDGAYRIRDQQNLADATHKKTRARLRVSGADNRRAHGWRVNLVIGDEPAQWGPRGELLAAAIRTALGKRAGARALFIGTRPATDAHFFARLLDEVDPSVYAQVHAAAPDDPPFRVSTWRKANPGLAHGLPDIEALRAEARLAKRDPTELATFRALRLNQGTSEVDVRMLVDALVWRGVEVETLPPAEGPVAFGVDLGGTAAFSACAAYWPRTGRLEGFVSCGREPALAQRALADGVAGVYETMRDAGELVQLGGRVVPVGPFIAEAVRRYGVPQAIAADRWRDGELEDGVNEARLTLPPPTWRGQGWRDGGADVRAFRTAVLEGGVAAPVSLAMRAALAEAKTVSDPAGNEKLAKAGEGQHRRRGRDDLAAAIVLAVAEGQRREAGKPKPRWRYAGAA
ncbi:hypothetical protein [Candidatus Palauibacter sp.]|uniref:hypothetical protein n=1 Tax=Candidatus Palauibacter sp. TaxID=3101350 RepID=UPI003AF2D251